MVPLFLFLLLVGVWLSDHGMGIPCVFYSLTGLQCPGCGVTRMFSALFKGDFSAAYHSNAAIFLLLPILAGIGCYASVHWLKTGSWAFPPLDGLADCRVRCVFDRLCRYAQFECAHMRLKVNKKGEARFDCFSLSICRKTQSVS